MQHKFETGNLVMRKFYTKKSALKLSLLTIMALSTSSLAVLAKSDGRVKDAYALRAMEQNQAEQNPYHGIWKTEAKGEETKTAHVKIGPCAGVTENLCGKIVHLDEPNDPKTGQPKTDQKNKKKDLRDRQIMGLEMISNLKPNDRGGYSDGTIYSPKTGKTYDASVKLSEGSTDVLNVTGHVLFFKSTQTWTRVAPKADS